MTIQSLIAKNNSNSTAAQRSNSSTGKFHLSTSSSWNKAKEVDATNNNNNVTTTTRTGRGTSNNKRTAAVVGRKPSGTQTRKDGSVTKKTDGDKGNKGIVGL